MQSSNGIDNHIISKIKVEELFGIYSYNIPESGALKNAAILYGDNGAGKSTVLRLAFHLLSAAPDRGHRTALYKANFKRLEVTLKSGHILSATKVIKKERRKVLLLEIRESATQKPYVEWEHIPRRNARDEDYFRSMQEEFIFVEGNVIKKKTRKVSRNSLISGMQGYIDELSRLVPETYILNADRRLDSDSVADPSDEVELRNLMRFEESSRFRDLVSRSKEIALAQALSTAAKWISRKVLQSANKGTENVHSVYGSVLNHILGKASVIPGIAEEEEKSLSERLADIQIKTGMFAKYEFSTPLNTDDFKEAVLLDDAEKKNLARNLIIPYIESLESRLAAVEPIYEIVNKFVSIVNKLLVDKEVFYTVNQGFKILNKNCSTLEPSQLSSGEQQLLLLFCYVLTGRDKPCVFMIDEPEISLNVKWQRELIDYLLELTENSTVQFIFASHSLEILSQHSDGVIPLRHEK